MFYKRTRLFVQFNFINLFQILRSIFIKKKNFLVYLKKFLQVDNLILTSFGRTALFEIIKIIITKTNKKTFHVAPYTIPCVIHAIIYAGGKVSYIDMDHKTGLIDEDKLIKKINDDSAGVIITHLYSNKSHIKNFINKFNKKIFIIEDAAINFGAKIDDKFLGTLGDFGFFSFAMVKNLNTFTGGAIYIKDKSLFDKYVLNRKTKKFPLNKTFNLLLTALFIKILFNNFFYQFVHYFLKFVYKYKIKIILKKIYPILFHTLEKQIPVTYFYDFNWIMNDVAIYNLNNIKKKFDERISKAKLYKTILNDEVVEKTNCLNGENALLEYPIILKKISNIEAHNRLMMRGYDIRHTWYINNIKNNENLKIHEFNESNLIEKKILCLPLHENITVSDVNKIASIVNTFN